MIEAFIFGSVERVMVKKILKSFPLFIVITLFLIPFWHELGADIQGKTSGDVKGTQSAVETPVPVSGEVAYEGEAVVDEPSIFAQAWRSGFVVFSVLTILVAFSVGSWTIVFTKVLYLRRISEVNEGFIKTFWDSRSLNDLNGKLAEFPYSPVKEVFRTGYAELVRGTQLKEQASSSQLAIHAATQNLHRALTKAKRFEKKRMEKYLTFLAITASASPFIGLFGTVWGIMKAFEGIARTGSASLAAVAPGISEALIATAFGLVAAIPAVIGYNLSNAKIRHILSNIDGFSADFLNIVERYLVTDRSKNQSSPTVGGPM